MALGIDDIGSISIDRDKDGVLREIVIYNRKMDKNLTSRVSEDGCLTFQKSSPIGLLVQAIVKMCLADLEISIGDLYGGGKVT